MRSPGAANGRTLTPSASVAAVEDSVGEPGGQRTRLGAAFFVAVVRLCAVGLFAVLRTGAFRVACFTVAVLTACFAVVRTGAFRVACFAVAVATPFFAVLG